MALSLLTLGLAAAPAMAVPEATTSVACGATGEGADFETLGPLPVGLSADCDVQGDYYQAASQAQTDFGPGIPRVGFVSSAASASSGSFFRNPYASASGTVIFYFEIKEETPPPFAPVTFPMYFEAKGEGSLSEIFDAGNLGYASSSFSAYTYLAAADIFIGLTNVYSSETSGESFNESTLFDLDPNTPSNPF